MEHRLYSGSECRELDRLAIRHSGVTGFELMMRAGKAAFAQLCQRWPSAHTITVCCGRGNNAGDGYIVAGLASEIGLGVQLLQLGSSAALSGDAALARDWAFQRNVVCVEISGQPPAIAGDVVVDALLGTGFTGVLRPPYAGLVDLMNAGPAVLAIDIPTGVEADTGAVNSTAVNAAMTVTYIGRKIGLFTGAGVAAAGEVVFADLGVGAEILRTVMGIPLLSYPAVTSTYPLPVRDANAYKQRIGHVAVIGGDHSMGGAPLMAAEAALRVGAGLVTVVTRAEHRGAILSRRPEIMVVDADDERRRGEILEKAATLVVGPGLGREAWGMNLLEEALRVTSPVVLDADGLNGFASGNLEASGPVVVTPHVGEAAALLGAGSHEIAADRPGAALRLASKVRGVSVLKGAGSVVAHHGSTGARVLGICAHGNPGMASAGMGDVLAGVIGGLLAQGLSTAAAAAVGVTLHSRAADVAAEHIGQRSLLATDLIPAMIELLAGC